MTVSIIIPVYNNISIINEIKTKITNLKKFHQIIIIDDCSIDKTVSILSEYVKEQGLKNTILIKNNKNMGPSYSRNVGIKKATGDYIAFLDSDDDWHPQKIDIQIKFMERTNSKICGTSHKSITKEELIEYNKINYDIDDIQYSLVKWPKVLFITPFATPSVIIHKSLNSYFFDETMKYAEDYNLWKKITYTYPAIKILSPLTYTFKHDYISDSSCLSGNAKLMQKGVNKSFISIFNNDQIKLFYKPLVVLAYVFSYIKYIRRIIKAKLN